MTATQAPTPGPLSGDLAERLRFAETWDLDADQQARDRCGVLMLEAAEALERLAPTAPVEASGSERETVFDGEAHDLVQTAQALAIAIERVPDWLMNDNLLTAHCHAQVLIADLPAALRPQPSGETRGALLLKQLREAVRAYWQGNGEEAAGGYAKWAAVCEALQAYDRDALTTPARAEAQDEGAAGEWPEKWSGDCTVGNMIANLKTLPPEMPLYTAYHIPMDGEPSLLRVKRPTMSRERVDGITIKTGDKSVPYSAVIWTQPQDPLEAHPSPTPAADAEGVREAVTIVRDRLRQIWEGDTHLVYSGNPPEPSHDEEGDLAKLANEAVKALNSVFPVPDALAALKSTAAKEGGAL
jgi:hypothetical protein